MATYTGVADINGDFEIPFSTAYTSAEKITVTASKDGDTRSVELYAPSEVSGGGDIQFSGNLTNFPNNIGVVTLSGEMINIPAYGFSSSNTSTQRSIFASATGLILGLGMVSVGNSGLNNWVGCRFFTAPPTLTTYGNNALTGWTGVNQPLVIGGNVILLGSSSFSLWSNCPSLIIGIGVTVIPNTCFSGWTSATRVEILGQVTEMQTSAFSNLTSCNEFIIHTITPPTIQSNTFASLKSTCIIKVPAESVAAYQAAPNWSVFASRIEAV